ncbi:nickel-dependent lactate racemase [Candidatus Aerophobetes bacterium]|nr:nickel-dependent lactate racemase [Candidatus Aerophobetes bacterium]
MNIILPYGKDRVSVSFDRERLAFILNLSEASGLTDLKVEVERALQNPIGTSGLKHLVKANDSVVILVDDNTRLTPVKRIIPYVLSELLKVGVSEKMITILVAAGTHRDMTDLELREKLGANICDRFKIEQHNYRDKKHLRKVGETDGIPIAVNATAVEADFLMGIGNIIPHCDFGFSGGAKIVEPGICGYTATAFTHTLCQIGDEIPLGKVENPARLKAEAMAKKAGLAFILNVVLNSKNEIVSIVAGDPVKAHREGVKKSRSIYGASFSEPAKILICSAYPADKDFWQAAKGLAAAYFACKKDGIIILTSPCREGVADKVHLQWTNYWLKMTFAEICKKLNKADYEDEELDFIAGGGAAMIARIREHATVILVSDGISEKDTARLGFLKSPSLQEATDFALRRFRDGSVGVIPMGGDTLPLRI